LVYDKNTNESQETQERRYHSVCSCLLACIWEIRIQGRRIKQTSIFKIQAER